MFEEAFQVKQGKVCLDPKGRSYSTQASVLGGCARSNVAKIRELSLFSGAEQRPVDIFIVPRS